MGTEVEPVLAYQQNILNALDSTKGLVKAEKDPRRGRPLGSNRPSLGGEPLDEDDETCY